MTADKPLCDLFDFISASPTPFHAAREMARRLDAAGFEYLAEDQMWSKPPKKFYTLRNASSLIALSLPDKRSPADLADSGIHLVGTHTDSPSLRLKPYPEITTSGYLQFGVEVYGGALLHPWFDRDLGIAGRISGYRSDRTLGSALINSQRPVAIIPSLAIHLNREANQKGGVNPQKELPPITCLVTEAPPEIRQWLASLQDEGEAPVNEVLDFELSLFDTQPPAQIGINREFIASARLDNLLSCWCALQGLIKADDPPPALLVANDHEEVGSTSAGGAQGPFLRSLLERLTANDPVHFARMTNHSLLISVDNAHALHPNYPDRHDPRHTPLLNGGPVIKINANQRYATDSTGAAFLRQLSDQNGVPIQTFVARSDLGCGTTIGPVTAAEIGIRTVDLGLPQLAMHSIREVAGTQDPACLIKLLTAFWRDRR